MSVTKAPQIVESCHPWWENMEQMENINQITLWFKIHYTLQPVLLCGYGQQRGAMPNSHRKIDCQDVPKGCPGTSLIHIRGRPAQSPNVLHSLRTSCWNVPGRTLETSWEQMLRREFGVSSHKGGGSVCPNPQPSLLKNWFLKQFQFHKVVFGGLSKPYASFSCTSHSLKLDHILEPLLVEKCWPTLIMDALLIVGVESVSKS